MPPVLEKRGYKVINTGSFDPFAENFTSQITAFKSAGVEIVTSVPSPTFTQFLDAGGYATGLQAEDT